MKQQDLLAIMREGREASARARDAANDHRGEGRRKAKAAFAYAVLRHAAWVVVSYTRKVANKDDLLVSIPPPPEGFVRPQPWADCGFEWPTGFIVGSLATDSERKAAAEAIAADALLVKDLAANDFSSTRNVLETYQGEMTMAMAFLKAEQHEQRIDAMAGADDREMQGGYGRSSRQYAG